MFFLVSPTKIVPVFIDIGTHVQKRHKRMAVAPHSGFNPTGASNLTRASTPQGLPYYFTKADWGKADWGKAQQGESTTGGKQLGEKKLGENTTRESATGKKKLRGKKTGMKKTRGNQTGRKNWGKAADSCLGA